MVSGSLVMYLAEPFQLSELRWTQSDEKLTRLVQFVDTAFLVSRIGRAAILDLREALANKFEEVVALQYQNRVERLPYVPKSHEQRLWQQNYYKEY